jgi:hypothetical protein
VYGAVMASVFIANPELFLWGIALFALGYPMYGIIRKYTQQPK